MRFAKLLANVVMSLDALTQLAMSTTLEAFDITRFNTCEAQWV